MLERVDKGVGMILDELGYAGIADNTLIVFSSDNGGERWASNEPLFHHKNTVWEGGIRVPCVMRCFASQLAKRESHLPNGHRDQYARHLPRRSRR